MSHAKRVVGLCTVMLLFGVRAHARAARIPSVNGHTEHRVGMLPSAGKWTQVDPVPRHVSPAPEEGPAPIDASTPTIVIGEVKARTDRQGRLLVLVDEWTESGPPDGIPDRAFLFQSERAIEEHIDERLQVASVDFRNSSLYVTSPGAGLVLDLAVGTDSDSRKTVGRAVVLHDGLALQSRLLGLEPVIPDPSVLEDVTVVLDGSGTVEAQSGMCDSGGSGSMACDYSCSMSGGSISKTDGCGVTCREGYYACCGCNMFYNATCMCVKETVIGPDAPSSRIDF